MWKQDLITFNLVWQFYCKNPWFIIGFMRVFSTPHHAHWSRVSMRAITMVFAPSRSSCGFLARFTDCGRNRMHHCMFGTSPTRDGFAVLFWVVKSCWSTASTSSSSEVYSNSCPGACGARTRAIECEVSVIWFHRAMERLPFLWYHVCAPESSGAVRPPWSFNGKLVLGPVTWLKPGGCWLQPPLRCRVLPQQRSDSVTIPSPFIQASCTSFSE